jgi:hypothetical protein
VYVVRTIGTNRARKQERVEPIGFMLQATAW